MIREGGDPSEYIAELMGNLRRRAFAHRLRQLTEFLSEPGHRRGDAPVSVSFPVGAVDDVLEFPEVHVPTVPVVMVRG